MKIFQFRLRFHWSVPNGPIHNIPTLVQMMAWRRPAIFWSNDGQFIDAYMHHSASVSKLIVYWTPVHCQNQCWNIVYWTPGNKFQWNYNQIHTFSFAKMHLKMSAANWWPFCLGPNMSKRPLDKAMGIALSKFNISVISLNFTSGTWWYYDRTLFHMILFTENWS